MRQIVARGIAEEQRHALPMSQDVNEVRTDLNSAIAKTVDAAKAAGLSRGKAFVLLRGACSFAGLLVARYVRLT